MAWIGHGALRAVSLLTGRTRRRRKFYEWWADYTVHQGFKQTLRPFTEAYALQFFHGLRAVGILGLTFETLRWLHVAALDARGAWSIQLTGFPTTCNSRAVSQHGRPKVQHSTPIFGSSTDEVWLANRQPGRRARWSRGTTRPRRVLN